MFFSKICGENLSFIKMGQEKRVIYMNTNFWSYLAQFFLEWEMSETKVVEKIQTQFVFNNFPPPRKPCGLWDNGEK
jgi:hypothetical protein